MEKYFDITEFEILVFYDEKERKIRAIIQLWCKNRTGSGLKLLQFHPCYLRYYLLSLAFLSPLLVPSHIFLLSRKRGVSRLRFLRSDFTSDKNILRGLTVVSRKVIFRSKRYQITLSDIAFSHFSTYTKFTLSRPRSRTSHSPCNSPIRRNCFTTNSQ